MDFYRWKFASYRDKTLHLDPYQDGCYRRLLDEYMATRQPLPDNDYALARICGISFDDWMLRAASIVRAFFKQKNGKLYQQTCDEELDFQDNRSHFRSEKAKKAANIRHSKNKNLDATSMPDECLAMPELRVKSQERKKESPPIPQGFVKFWEAYPKTRRDSQNKTLPAYRKALTITTEENLYAAVIRYASSDEVARGFGKGTVAWLNGERWNNDYRTAPQPVNGKRSYSDSLEIAAQVANRVLDEKEKIRREELF